MRIFKNPCSETILRNCPKSDLSNAPAVNLAGIWRTKMGRKVPFERSVGLHSRHLRDLSDSFSRQVGE